MTQKLKVVVCGTKFGHIYLSAFMLENIPFELAGILAKNSDRSKQYARDFNVPLFFSVEELPNDIDIACVVVRSTIVGGDGTKLAMQLMERGIHIIQEHPVYYDEIVQCVRKARTKGVRYQLNTHHVNAAPVRTFTDYINKAREKNEIRFIDAIAGVQTVCSLLDIIGHVLGGFQPFEFTLPLKPGKNILGLCKCEIFPFQCIQGAIAGVPITLKIQNYYDPDDPDNHAAILHRICVVMNSGNITLLNTNGPIVWSDEFFISTDHSNCVHFHEIAECMCANKRPTAVSFSEHFSPSISDVISGLWPEAVLAELLKMKQSIEKGQSERQMQYYIDLCQIWRAVMLGVGNPRLLPMGNPIPPYPDPMDYRQKIILNED
ncbi:Gfo/Idh/MocA family oxidoreductase [Desulfobacter sp.]|uniref:Gfo/Idh/MocA family oxidoreductase n=1 Tax=Desulfobacter sp. TaxID=2294 RepID=UPI000E9FD847|nr:Gfo/Idh/MocA family oxidoreductase [Desulfobacter sp.]HBT89714.1 thiazolinyl imide reductase [Desulfobacter sp.]